MKINRITTDTAFPVALENTFGKKCPVIFRVSDSKIVKNEGIASINKSINVICNGINGNGVFVVVAKYSDNTEKTLVLGTDYYLSNYEHTFVTADITTAVKFTVTLYESAQAGDTHKDCTLSINAVADYVTGFTASQKTSGDPAKPTTVYTRGETTVSVDQFDFKVTSYAVAKVETGVNDTITTGVTIFDTPSKVPAGYPSNTLRVWFRVGSGDTAVTTYCDVPVVDPVDGDGGDEGLGG